MFVKNLQPVLRMTCHMLYSSQYSHSPEKHKKQLETQNTRLKMKEDSVIKREIKKLEEKEKKKYSQEEND